MINIKLKIKKSKSSLRRRLFVIMFAIALVATIINTTVFGITFAKTLNISNNLQKSMSENVHGVIEMLLFQQDGYIKEVYVSQQVAFINEYLENIEEQGNEPDWEYALKKSYDIVNNSKLNSQILDELNAIQYIYVDGEFYIYSNSNIGQDEFLKLVNQFYLDGQIDGAFLDDLNNNLSFLGETMGENGKALVNITLKDNVGSIGMYVSLTAADTSETLRLLIEEELDLATAQNAEAIFYAGIVLMIFLLVIIIALIFVSKKMSNAFVTPVEYELNRAAEEKAMTEKINRLKTEFLGNVAHELKTPLTIVSGYAQDSEQRLLDNNKDNEVLINHMKLISSEAERLALMVSQILDITRIDEGRMSISPYKTSITMIIQRTVDAYYPVLNKNNNKLNLDLAYDLPEIFADNDRVSQVIVNLLSNAIRHTHNGKIVISAVKDGEFVEVSIKDNGIGISEEMLPQLFDRYKSGGLGTGLGLYICKYIVTAHGGEIRIESKQNEGTCIKFTLPISS